MYKDMSKVSGNIKLFLSFLEEKGVLGMFTEDFLKSTTSLRKGSDLLGQLEYIEKNLPPTEFVKRAFSWSFTEKGFKYYKELDSRWRGRLYSLQPPVGPKMALLYEFLQEKGCFEMYIDNIFSPARPIEGSPEKIIKNLEETVETSSLLYESFSFSLTPEGAKYWHDLSVGWSDRVQQYEEHRTNPFVEFLTSEGVIMRYIKEAIIHHKSLGDILEYLDKVATKEYYVTQSFSWSGTMEGFEFWKKVQQRWHAVNKIEVGNKMKLFLAFLKDKGAFEKFIRNIERYNQSTASEALQLLERHSFMTSYVGRAFTWGDNEQGFKFWDDIATEWKSKVLSGEAYLYEEERGLRELLNFLRSNRAVDKYLLALTEAKGNEDKSVEDLIEEIALLPMVGRIDLPFLWHDTVEGIPYWRDIDKKWKNCVDYLEQKSTLSDYICSDNTVDQCSKEETVEEEEVLTSQDDINTMVQTGEDHASLESTTSLVKQAIDLLKNIRERAKDSYTTNFGVEGPNYAFMSGYMEGVAHTAARLLEQVVEKLEERE